jgi:hypothetical protein
VTYSSFKKRSRRLDRHRGLLTDEDKNLNFSGIIVVADFWPAPKRIANDVSKNLHFNRYLMIAKYLIAKYLIAKYLIA